MKTVIICPSCGIENSHSQLDCRCGADLRLLSQLNLLTDAWFNQGLQAVDQGKYGDALRWFCACCTACPTDAEAWLAQAQVWKHLGHWQESHESLFRAREIDPNMKGISTLAAELKQLQTLAAHQEENEK